MEDKPVEKLLEYFTIESLRHVVDEAVKKNPDLAENVRQLADVDSAQREIFVHVHGLGWDATAETLTSVFGKYGEIEDCKHYTDKHTGKLKSFAFILFKHRSSVRMALKQPLKKIGNRATVCQLAISPGPFASYLFTYWYGEDALEEYHKNLEGTTLYFQEAVDGTEGNKGYHQQQQQPHYPSREKKSKYSHDGGPSYCGDCDRLMVPASLVVGGYNPGVPQQGLNPALVNQGAGLQLGDSLGGLDGAPVNQAGPIHVAYGDRAAMIYVNQPVMEQGYQNPQMGHGGQYWNPPGMQQGYRNPQMGHGRQFWNPPGMQQGYQNPQMGHGGQYGNPPGMQQGYQNPQMGHGGQYRNPPGMQQGYQNTQMGHGGQYWNLLGMQQEYQNPQMGQGDQCHHWNPPRMQQGYKNPLMGQGGHHWNPPGMEQGYQNPPMGQGGQYWNPPRMQQGYQNPQMGHGGQYWNPPGMHQGYQNPPMGQGGGARPQPGAGAPYMGH